MRGNLTDDLFVCGLSNLAPGQLYSPLDEESNKEKKHTKKLEHYENCEGVKFQEFIQLLVGKFH